jgi:hypothetical protein
VQEKQGTLREVNEAARSLDATLAEVVLRGGVDAVIAVSCDPAGVNELLIQASKWVTNQLKCLNSLRLFALCRETKLAIVGTGGTSISYIIGLGCNVIGSSGGSVATTPLSKVYADAACI